MTIEQFVAIVPRPYVVRDTYRTPLSRTQPAGCARHEMDHREHQFALDNRLPDRKSDPSERNYRTGLLPRVVAAKRTSGYGCRMRGAGNHLSTRRFIRVQVSR